MSILKLFRPLFTAIGGFLGVVEHTKLYFYAKNANKKQEKVLKGLMRDNKSTAYGKSNNFDKVKSVDDYQKIVPLSVYGD